METEIKFNEEFMEKALAAFKAGNGNWGDIYDKAPEKAKKRLRIAFWFSTYQKDVTPEVKEEYRMAREATGTRPSWWGTSLTTVMAWTVTRNWPSIGSRRPRCAVRPLPASAL